jgi:hypothetical protein
MRKTMLSTETDVRKRQIPIRPMIRLFLQLNLSTWNDYEVQQQGWEDRRHLLSASECQDQINRCQQKNPNQIVGNWQMGKFSFRITVWTLRSIIKRKARHDAFGWLYAIDLAPATTLSLRPMSANCASLEPQNA